MIQAYAQKASGSDLKPFEYDPGELLPDQVELEVAYCGICRSDLSRLDNRSGGTEYPFVPGHEVAGTVGKVGENVRHLSPGMQAGLGWFSSSCMTCSECISGQHNLCPRSQPTMVGRHGGFATKIRCHSAWAVRIPDNLDLSKAGPLFCGGLTVFNSIVQTGVQPTDRVGVIGIGGLGHMALQFLRQWGCEVVAFTSSGSKKADAIELGAHRVLNSKNKSDLAGIRGKLDFILSTVPGSLEWGRYLNALAPKGHLHVVGFVPEPIQFPAAPMLIGQRSISGSPVGSPATLAKMLDFCGRHEIAPLTEEFPLSGVNDALEHLRVGKARYRVVLKNDLTS